MPQQLGSVTVTENAKHQVVCSTNCEGLCHGVFQILEGQHRLDSMNLDGRLQTNNICLVALRVVQGGL